MKLGILLAAGLLTLGGVRIPHQVQDTSDQAHQQWLDDRYMEATSIKEGMSRADLLKLFEQEGGLQTIPASRYVLKRCRMIKVNVKFDTKYGVEYKPVPDEDLKIREVSKPYLERMIID